MASNISYRLPIICKQIYLTNRWDPNSYYHPRSERTIFDKNNLQLYGVKYFLSITDNLQTDLFNQ